MLIGRSRFQKMPRGRAKADEKPSEKNESSGHSDAKPGEEKAALAEVDENTEDAKPAPKRGRGRPPKDKTASKSGGGAENVENSEAGEEPAVKKTKKKPQTSKNVKKISIEFCKS